MKTAMKMTPQEIKSLRDRLGLTAKEFADMVGVSENTVHRWVMGVRHASGSAVLLMRQLEKQTVNQGR